MSKRNKYDSSAEASRLSAIDKEARKFFNRSFERLEIKKMRIESSKKRKCPARADREVKVMLKVFRLIVLAFLLAGMANVGSAGDMSGIRNLENLNVDVWVNKGEGATYYYGEDVAIYFRASDDCYVVVYDIDPEGNVSLIYPADYDSDTFVRGGDIYRIPDTYDDYRLEVSGPSGSEYIYAVASYSPMSAPGFIRSEYFEYGEWDSYYDDFIHSVRGERAAFANDLNWRIAQGPHVSTSTMFYINADYRHHRWYRHWRYDPYYIGSVWVGSSYPGCEVWIDGVYFGIAPILVPEIYIGRHWIWIYYNGYPCWQDYVYIRYGQRYYVDAKIKRDYRDSDYRQGKLRTWTLKQEHYRNESDFTREAEKVRIKHTRPRPNPPSRIIDKYSRKGNDSEQTTRIEQNRAKDDADYRDQSAIVRKTQGREDNRSGEQDYSKKNKNLNSEDKKPIIKEDEKQTTKKSSKEKETQTQETRPAKINKGSSPKTGNTTKNPSTAGQQSKSGTDDKQQEKRGRR